RPQNPFILYRRDKFEKHKTEYKRKGLNQAEISKILGEMWSNEKPEVKELFRALGRLAEKIHTDEYKNYKYEPKQ
ncbi:high mobility group box domain-containing protein, partial [Glomus cerebriforme]